MEEAGLAPPPVADDGGGGVACCCIGWLLGVGVGQMLVLLAKGRERVVVVLRVCMQIN